MLRYARYENMLLVVRYRVGECLELNLILISTTFLITPLLLLAENDNAAMSSNKLNSNGAWTRTAVASREDSGAAGVSSSAVGQHSSNRPVPGVATGCVSGGGHQPGHSSGGGGDHIDGAQEQPRRDQRGGRVRPAGLLDILFQHGGGGRAHGHQQQPLHGATPALHSWSQYHHNSSHADGLNIVEFTNLDSKYLTQTIA